MSEPRRPAGAQVRRIIGLQAAVGTVLALLLWGPYGRHAALSAFAGGAIAALASAAYAWRMMVSRSRDPRALLRAHYAAELARFAITVGLFAGVFLSYGGVAALPLFLTYAAALLVYWVALILD